MPRAERERARLTVFRAFFDDSGKEGIAQSPVYLLAGFSAHLEVWNDFADEWQEITSAPRSASTIPAIAAAGERSEMSSTRTTPSSGPAMSGPPACA